MRKPTPTKKARARAPRPVFPFAVTLRAAALIYEGDGRPALYVCADNHTGNPCLYRVPEDARVSVKAPHPLPEEQGRVFLPAGSAVTFETPTGKTVLALHAVRVCRELLEALEAHAHALQVWQAARAHFEGRQGAA